MGAFLTPFAIYQLIVTAVLLSLLGMVALNLFTLTRMKDSEATGSSQSLPTVAVLLPARNEEANIEQCLRSIIAQDYPNLEIWLYDDVSTDATPQIAAKVAWGRQRDSPQLHIIAGTEGPPPCWLGKANACHRLYAAMSAHSEPDMVLFIDADVRFEPSAVRYAVLAARGLKAGLLSIFPRQITVSWAERLTVPVLLHWAVYSFLPLPLAFSSRTSPAFAAANGQFMLFTRQAYEACGGHSAVHAQILEDVALARAVKSAGYRSMLADGGALVYTHMYSGAMEVWQGYSKNAYAFFGYSPIFLVPGIVALVALYVAPIFFAFYAAFVSHDALLLLLSVAQYVIAIIARVLLALRFRYRLLDTLLHPVAIAYLIAIAVNSMRWSLEGKGAWKGRGISSPSAGSGQPPEEGATRGR